MRRLIALALALLVVAWPLPLPAQTGTLPSPVGSIWPPAGILTYFTASRPVTNTTASVYLTSIVIPASMFATQAAANTTFANLGPQNSSVPLHLQLVGLLQRQTGTINLAVNYGVGTTTNPIAGTTGAASMVLINAYAPTVIGPGACQNAQGPFALGGVPATIDIWLSAIATNTDTNTGSGSPPNPAATPNILNTVFMNGRAQWSELCTGATTTIFNTATVGQVNTASAHILNVILQFGTALSGNNFILLRSILQQGL